MLWEDRTKFEGAVEAYRGKLFSLKPKDKEGLTGKSGGVTRRRISDRQAACVKALLGQGWEWGAEGGRTCRAGGGCPRCDPTSS